MYLQRLSLTNFKNYSEAELELSEKINCFIGNNGVGKTNLLDAIYYLSFCKSYFNPVDSQNIKHQHDFFAIHGRYITNGDKTDTVSCIQKAGVRKQFRLNKKEYERLADHIGLLPLVMVSPYDRDLINEGSDIRRKYIDGVISQFDKLYLDDLINYNKILAHRNALLKQFFENNYFDAASLDIWDERMIKPGENIYTKRKLFLKEFAPIFQHYYEFIAGSREKVEIEYVSHLHDSSIKEILNDALEKDRVMRYTTMGVHKDDIEMKIDGYPVKKFGSQGQQKSFVIAVKLAQFDYTKNVKGFKPILLFDDIFDKLDDIRVEQLIKLVSENSFGQVFITDTQQQRIEKLFNKVKIDHRIYKINGGVASEVVNNKS